MQHEGRTAPGGELHLKVTRGDRRFDQIAALSQYPAKELSLAEIARYGLPQPGLDPRVNAWRTANFRNLMRGARRAILARKLGLSNIYGSLYLTLIKGDGEILELGLASMRVVTTVGVNYMVDAFQNTTELENLKFHGYGVGTTVEAVGDTALVTEETTQYATDNTRPTGTTTEGASANIYRTVATYSPDSGTNPRAITEHGVFSASSAGTLLDRSVFAAVNLVPAADSLQSTFDFTISAGGA